MSEFYIKNREGKFLPIQITNILGKELNDHLVVIRVGTDELRASENDLDDTVESFNRADFLKDLNNLSIVITPYQIDVSACPKSDLEEKSVYLQITSGSDILMLEEQIKKIYNKMKKTHDTVIVQTPLKIGEYLQAQDVLKRCQIRKERRGNKNK